VSYRWRFNMQPVNPELVAIQDEFRSAFSWSLDDDFERWGRIQSDV